MLSSVAMGMAERLHAMLSSVAMGMTQRLRAMLLSVSMGMTQRLSCHALVCLHGHDTDFFHGMHASGPWTEKPQN